MTTSLYVCPMYLSWNKPTCYFMPCLVLYHATIRIIKVPSYKKGDLAQLDRHWNENPKVLVFYSQWGKLFAINLLFTTKQYKVDNIDNFVYYGKTRLVPYIDVVSFLRTWFVGLETVAAVSPDIKSLSMSHNHHKTHMVFNQSFNKRIH